MNEIMNTAVDYLESVFGIATPSKFLNILKHFLHFFLPGLKDTREIVVELGHQYPEMFFKSENPEFEFDGYEGATSKLDLNDLAQKLVNRVRSFIYFIILT